VAETLAVLESDAIWLATARATARVASWVLLWLFTEPARAMRLTTSSRVNAVADCDVIGLASERCTWTALPDNSDADATTLDIDRAIARAATALNDPDTTADTSATRVVVLSVMLLLVLLLAKLAINKRWTDTADTPVLDCEPIAVNKAIRPAIERVIVPVLLVLDNADCSDRATVADAPALLDCDASAVWMARCTDAAVIAVDEVDVTADNKLIRVARLTKIALTSLELASADCNNRATFATDTEVLLREFSAAVRVR